MNYGQLKSQVAARLHRTDLTSVIPECIEAARVRIGADLRSLSNYKAAAVSGFTSGRATLPADLGSISALRDADGTPLTFVHVAEVEYNSGTMVYSVDGPDLIVPQADSGSSYNLTYFAIPAALSNDSDVSDSMNEWPGLWQYATMIEAAIYLQDWELYDRMVDAYQGTLSGANWTGNLYGPGLRMIDSGRNALAAGSGL